jgi:hypothetical protein
MVLAGACKKWKNQRFLTEILSSPGFARHVTCWKHTRLCQLNFWSKTRFLDLLRPAFWLAHTRNILLCHTLFTLKAKKSLIPCVSGQNQRFYNAQIFFKFCSKNFLRNFFWVRPNKATQRTISQIKPENNSTKSTISHRFFRSWKRQEIGNS